ncbi:MAG: 50S ribosomal protein L29 [Chloroflexi bacterium]|nr:50S ribosomal protein L29 [Chloroflexota bacterium]MBT9165536.1 50S ribosomal protein L29 [Chloroflexota bacterium]
MRISEIRKLNYQELKRELEISRQELFNLRFRAATKQLTNYRELNKVKRTIARLNTVIREQEVIGNW